MPLRLEVLVRRGEIVESRHRLELALADPSGRCTAATETPGRVTTFRSSAKPFQLLPLAESGAAERWGFSDEDLAVMAASHTGSPYHVALVEGILQRIGCTAADLACGHHEPDDPESQAAIRKGASAPSPLYNNCSGKHAGMLALARAEGWPVEGYPHPDHPVQRVIHRTVAELCSVAPEAMVTAIDGCSVPVFAVPLQAMARAYAVLASAVREPDGSARSRALARIGAAMMAFPKAVAGEGRLTTELMRSAPGRLVAKGGAEGLQLVGHIELGLGLAIKCIDGASRASGPATIAALERFGWLDAAGAARLAPLREPRLRNHAGLDVGVITAELHEGVPA
jgi:L-asparaginase II